MEKKKYQQLKGQSIQVADYAMRQLFADGFAKMPAQCIIEIMKLIKGLREIDVVYSMRVVKDPVTTHKTLAYEFYFPGRIEGMNESK